MKTYAAFKSLISAMLIQTTQGIKTMKDIELSRDNYSDIIENNPPLKDTDISDYLKTHDINDMKNRDYVIFHNLHLILFLIKKHHIKEHERDDFKSICLFGLHKAVTHFNVRKNFSFRNYALTIMEHEIYKWWRLRMKDHEKTTSLDSRLDSENSEYSYKSFEAELSSEYNIQMERKTVISNTRMIIDEFLKSDKVNEYHKRIFRMNFIDDYNYTQIGRILGISKQRVAEINGKNIRYIKENMI